MNRQTYIEPAIRTIAGAFVVLCGGLIYLHPQLAWLGLAALFFIGINLFQSGITQFCLMEILLKKLNFRSERDEIGLLIRANADTEAKAAYFDTLELLDEVVIELSRGGELVFLSAHWFELMGVAHANQSLFLGSPMTNFINSQDRAPFQQMLISLMDGSQGTTHLRFRMLREDHKLHWVEGKFALYRQQDKIHGIRGVLRDVTEAHMQEKRISHMATHDALTSLPNRLYLDERIRVDIEHAAISGSKLALLFIDLDNFKQINDLHGHKTGDQLLIDVCSILQSSLRGSDVLARWGGDEFVVLLPFTSNADIAMNIARELMQKLHENLDEIYKDAFVTLSIGVAIYPDDAQSGEDLLMQADKALFYAKSQGRNNIQLFSNLQTRATGFEDVGMTARFVTAVKQGLLQVFFQPVLDSHDHNRVVGLEALARWHDEQYGWVSPASFIPLAENLGLINEVGRQIFEQALSHFSITTEAGSHLKLAINVSKRQLVSSDFFPMLLDMVARHGMQPGQIKLEITESIALQGIDEANCYLQKLSSAGFNLSLDDFGTGFSSLSHVHELPFDEIKIDISFVRRIKTTEGKILLRTIVDMGHAMNLTLVAEGVEDEETAHLLKDMGVEMLQGFYFSQPKPKDECGAFTCGYLNVPVPAFG